MILGELKTKGQVFLEDNSEKQSLPKNVLILAIKPSTISNLQASTWKPNSKKQKMRTQN